MTSVSVLIPTYNRAPLIDECIRSVLRQTVPPTQVIVVDDGSTDDTRERVERWGDAVRYVHKDNGGKSAALNFAMPLVTGEFLWLFDDDDVALDTALERRLAAFARQPGTQIVLTSHVWGRSGNDGSIEVTGPHRLHLPSTEGLLLALMHSCFITLQGALVRTHCYREVGAFREDLLNSQDYEMLIRLVHRYPTALVDEPTFVFRRHSGLRGSAGNRYTAELRENKFAEYDRILGKQLRLDVSLGDYIVPRVRGALHPAQQRQALLNRMSVMASKGLAEEMIDDAYAYALAVDNSGAPARLFSDERRVLISSVQQRYFVLFALQHARSFLTLASALAQTPTGRVVLRVWARGFMGAAKWAADGIRSRARLVHIAVGLVSTSRSWKGVIPARASHTQSKRG